jgi:gas vesicle structural protein
MDDRDDLDQVDLTLLDLVDHVLNKGVVLTGEATISLAGVDLIYLGLNVVLASVGTIERTLEARHRVTDNNSDPAAGPQTRSLDNQQP